MAGVQGVAEELNPAIIGGGYAGMAAAVELARRGIPVTVFESAKQLGGRARGVSYNDTQLDNGQHLLLGCYHDTLRLIELVGGNIAQDFLRLPLQLDLHGHFTLRAPKLPAPLHLLVALMRADGLTWNERLMAARFMLAMRSNAFTLPSHAFEGGTGGEGKDCTVLELLRAYGQDANLTLKLWEPLTLAALNTPIAQASAQVLLNVLRDSLNQARADSDMLLPRLDFTALFPQRAARFVEQRGGMVHLSCGVEHITPIEGGFELETALGVQRYSHVICATSPVVTARLLSTIPELAETVVQIEALEHQPIYTVYLQYPADVILPHAMLGLHQRVSQWLFDKGRISGQHGLIASVISAEGLHQQLGQDELVHKVIAELRVEFGIVQAPLWYKVIAEKRATFCCAPNLKRPSQRTALTGLYLAGDYTAGDYPATLEGAVRSGLHCAELCLPERK
ncbi:tRNA 5-methylaminomethyl-2-thiouridine biosynthesis bifunctional protein MnmC [Ferriphaselus amnicola]|uniref:tRNA 5-methylaminomethyl-2-thiouridine biosynthesis bifunctional protein MnmC n=1 Tax=Ferriphaselus amnicola TaxID=1188319 RepID=A0A2Z6G9N9_9PROT|nr:tRNA 5-methylaminomethyl-2-thiouridine biosynthesis bifunctional protein MnmC [Ferriphaselus amnicola]